MSDKITYWCLLCPEDDRYEDSDRVNVKRHISRSTDSRHRDRRGAEPGVIAQSGDEDVEEPGAETRENRIRTETGNRAYEGPEGGIDATMTHLAEITEGPGDTVHDVEVDQATLIALSDEAIVDIMSAETVDKETKMSILGQVKGSDPG